MGFARIGTGDFSDVFDLCDGTVVKAFRREQHTGGVVGNWEDEDALTVELFEAEVQAYERVRTVRDLAIYVPNYFGRIDPCQLLGTNDCKAFAYVKGCGIRLEKIRGTAAKVAHLDLLTKRNTQAILERFEVEVTPGNVWDASCFIPGSQADFTFIDFAVWEHFPECVDVLERQRVFTDQQRINLRLNHRI